MERSRRLRSSPILGLAIVSLATVGGLIPQESRAATIVVDSTADAIGDDGVCTLREAIIAANTNTASADSANACEAGDADPTVDEITFTDLAGCPCTITLSIAGGSEDAAATGDLDLTESVTLTGPGADQLTIHASFIDRVFDVIGSGVSVTLSGLTIENGFTTGSGAGVQVTTGDASLSLVDCVLQNNTHNSALGGGGAIAFTTNGTLTISGSTLFNNSTGGQGGAVYENSLALGGVITISHSTLRENSANVNGGGIRTVNTTLNIVNSTISGNRADSNGGGLLTLGTANLFNATITDNTADDNSDGGDGGGIAAFGTTTLFNTLLLGNTDKTGEAPDCDGSLASSGYNIVGDDTGCTFTATTGDQVDIVFDGSFAVSDIIDTTLQDNGGPTLTHALPSGSPALDRGRPELDGGCTDQTASALIADQRGFDRPLDSDTDGNVRCDIGAFEDGACGDGATDASEQCDNGGANSDILPDACRTDCTNAACGDGVTDTGEDCDDAGDSSACDVDCTSVVCGDAYVNPSAGEQCDDGNNTDGDGCQANCALPTCGDGIADAGEACDDGNADNTDACLNTCVAATCGDGFVRTGVEECDDANEVDNDGCTTGCILNTAGDLTAINSAIDFNDLTVDVAVTLQAPSPVDPAAPAPEGCGCVWSIGPEASGAFGEANACETGFTPLSEGDAEILVTVDCGAAGVGVFSEAIQIRSQAGGGCSLLAVSGAPR